MEKEKEKQIVYEGLAELTKQSDPKTYFSRKKIMEQVKNKIEKETGFGIHYRAGYKTNYQTKDGGLNWNNERIDLNDSLPRQKTLSVALEELVKEGKVEAIITESGGYGGSVQFYRANLDGEKIK